MRVIICGAGRVGQGIAERLAAEDNDVTVIDTSPALVQNIRDSLDVRGFVGHGAHPDVLERAGASEADMIIAVTLYDEVNMVACQLAHSVFNVPRKIARVRAQSYLDPQYADLFTSDHMPIDVIISPELEVGRMVLRRIALPGATDAVRFADDNVSFVAIECHEECPIVDTPLGQLTELFPDLSAVVVGIKRGDNVFVPHALDSMMVGDLAYVVVQRTKVRRTLTIFGHEEPDASRICIVGGGNIGVYVARRLEERQSNVRVKIIEANLARAKAIAEQLSRPVILHGNALDQEILREADIERTDLMVALTNDDQVNILSSIMAKRLGCEQTLTLLNNSGYYDFTHTLGIDAHVNPRSVTISKVLQFVRRGRIRSIHSVENGAGEVIEAEALETSTIVGRPLRDIDLPEGVRVGAVFRKGEVIRPDGGTVIRAKDRVVVFAVAERVREVERMFRVSLEFFA